MYDNFTKEAQELLSLAKREAAKKGHRYLTTEHLFLAIIQSDVSKYLYKIFDFDLEAASIALNNAKCGVRIMYKEGKAFELPDDPYNRRQEECTPCEVDDNIPLTPMMEKTIKLADYEREQCYKSHQKARTIMNKKGDMVRITREAEELFEKKLVTPEFLLMGMLNSDSESVGKEILERQKVGLDKFTEIIRDYFTHPDFRRAGGGDFDAFASYWRLKFKLKAEGLLSKRLAARGIDVCGIGVN